MLKSLKIFVTSCRSYILPASVCVLFYAIILQYRLLCFKSLSIYFRVFSCHYRRKFKLEVIIFCYTYHTCHICYNFTYFPSSPLKVLQWRFENSQISRVIYPWGLYFFLKSNLFFPNILFLYVCKQTFRLFRMRFFQKLKVIMIWKLRRIFVFGAKYIGRCFTRGKFQDLHRHPLPSGRYKCMVSFRISISS